MSELRIGVDARPLAHPYTGIGRYTSGLLRELIRGGERWFLYSDRPIRDSAGAFAQSNVVLREGLGRPPGLGSLWAQFMFVRWGAKDTLDLFWSPRHHLPLLLSRRIKRIVTVHDLVWKRNPETMTFRGRLLECLLMPPSLRQADSVLVDTCWTGQELREEYPWLAQRLRVIPAAADPVEPDRGPVDASDPAYFLFVGTLEPRKNLARLLAAYGQYVDRSESPLALYLVGAEGWGDHGLSTLQADARLGQHVRRLGQVDDDMLHELYRGASALLLPSLYEGFGLPVIEAMQHGIPVMVSQESAMAEVAGEGALLVDPLRESSILAGLLRLAQDSELRRHKGVEARKRAESYSWSNSARQLREIMAELAC